MKKIIFFNIILVFVISCHTKKENTEITKINTDTINRVLMQTDSIKNNKVKGDITINVMATTKVTNEFEKFVIEAFRQNAEDNKYHKRMDNGIDIKIDGRFNDLTYQETHPDSYFSIFKIFDSRGYIKEKGLIITKSVSGSNMGTWYYYDDSGKLKNEINDDKHFQFTFNDVLEFCKKEKFPVTKGIDYPKGKILDADNESVEVTYVTTIDRGDDYYMGVKYYWLIINYNALGTKQTVIYLDGQNGKVLSRKSGIITP